MALNDYFYVRGLLVLVLAWTIIRLLTNKYKRDLVSIPGPRLAAYTQLWRTWNVSRGQVMLQGECRGSCQYVHD